MHAIGRYQRDATDRLDAGPEDSASDAGKDDECGACVAAGMSRIHTHDLTHLTKRTRGGGKSPKRANDPAEMLAGERALWSDAAKVTQEEERASKANKNERRGRRRASERIRARVPD